MNNRTSPQHAGPQHLQPRRKAVYAMILCAAAGAALMGTAAAAASDDVPRVIVKYDPASLSDDNGARVLYQRIVRAATQVCPAVDARELHEAAIARECRRQSVARAVHDIASPRLAALHAVLAPRG